MCYAEYPTIVNNVPKDKNIYNNTLDDFAKVDSLLSASQTDIGESSNLAQIAQTYACNFGDAKYDDYVALLSIYAQIAIDSSKRRFCIDVNEEIRRIRQDLNIAENKYPAFWKLIKKGINKDSINLSLDCPMNYLYNLKFDKVKYDTPTLPMSYFFKQIKNNENRRICKKVEELIEAYSFNLYEYNVLYKDYYNRNDEYLLLRSDFDKLINDIIQVYISKNYASLMSWLINRSFAIMPSMKFTPAKTKLNKNRSLLIKVLYDVNKKVLLECFSGNLENNKNNMK